MADDATSDDDDNDVYGRNLTKIMLAFDPFLPSLPLMLVDDSNDLVDRSLVCLVPIRENSKKHSTWAPTPSCWIWKMELRLTRKMMHEG